MKKDVDRTCVIRIERDDEYIAKILERLDLSIKELKWYLRVISEGRKAKGL